MANKDILITQIDQFIIDYGMLPYGGIPMISMILNGYGDQSGIKETLASGITFTDQDIAGVANYFVEKYPGYPTHTYDAWYDGLSEGLADRIISDGGNGDGNGDGDGDIIEEKTGLSLSTILIGGTILLILLLPRE
jgi:hypothetical protein